MTELQKRVLSAAVLIPLVLGIIYIGGWVFNIFVVILAVLMLHEWFILTKGGGMLWKIGGTVYISVACWALYSVITIPGLFICDAVPGKCITDEGGTDFSRAVILFLLVWATDTGAYFAGRKFGGRKLAPKISPNKTWSGFFGGIIVAIFSISLAIILIDQYDFNSDLGNWTFLAISFIIAIFSIISQIGDLFESWVKRKFGVKDSGNLIPGHGGILDRLDGLLAVLFVLGVGILLG